MQINRSNYEIWLIDWIDGNLSDSGREQLGHFLIENPDLKTEFDELNSLGDLLNLIPDESFRFKEKLKKTYADLSGQQFEFLCTAFLENDLSEDQKFEFLQSFKQDTEKRKSFELIQKMKVVPPDLSFKQKNRLMRRTPGQKVIRLAVIGLSAAAIVSLVIINRISSPASHPVKADATAFEIEIKNSLLKPTIQSSSDKLNQDKSSRPDKKEVRKIHLASQTVIPALTKLNSYQTIPGDTLTPFSENPDMILNKIPVSERVNIEKTVIPNTLISLDSRIQIAEEDDSRPKLGRFLAKAFRQKILKENTTKDSPLKAYEIAEAGVSGLNKLLGWEMALDERKDENGKLKSVYFSSRILKFNAPIKNSEPQR